MVPVPNFALIACLLWAASAGAAEWQSLTGQHFVALYHEGQRPQADLAIAEADHLVERVKGDLGVEPGDRAEIVICRTHAEFEREIGRSLGIWILGIAEPERNRIVIKQESLSGMRALVRHEAVHLLVGKALGEADAAAPRWLQEGAAKYYADDWSVADREALADARKAKHLYSIDELAEFPTRAQQSAVAYAESYVLVEYLASLDPKRGLTGFLAEFRKTRRVDRAFVRAYGLSQQQVQEGLDQAIEVKTRGLPMAWAVETLIFFAMALIFVAGYLRVRRRSRAIRERMEQEELLERLFDETGRRYGTPPVPHLRMLSDEPEDEDESRPRP